MRPYNYSYSSWHGKAVQPVPPTRELEAHAYTIVRLVYLADLASTTTILPNPHSLVQSDDTYIMTRSQHQQH
jgi:hypothetical protein